MRIYEIAYVDQEGNQSEWFSSKKKAEKRHKELEADEGNEVVHDIYSHDLPLSKAGILWFLNAHCKTGD